MSLTLNNKRIKIIHCSLIISLNFSNLRTILKMLKEIYPLDIRHKDLYWKAHFLVYSLT